jgi:hypothetical protein
VSVDDVAQGPALLDIDGLEGPRKGRQQIHRVVDPLPIAAGGNADLLESWQFIEIDRPSGRVVAIISARSMTVSSCRPLRCSQSHLAVSRNMPALVFSTHLTGRDRATVTDIGKFPPCPYGSP